MLSDILFNRHQRARRGDCRLPKRSTVMITLDQRGSVARSLVVWVFSDLEKRFEKVFDVSF